MVMLGSQEAHPEVKVDPQREVLITLGATEALSSAMLALLNPGDEVCLSSMRNSLLPLAPLK